MEYAPKRDDATSPHKDALLLKRITEMMKARLGRRAFGAVDMILTPAAQMVMDEWYRGRVRELRKSADVRLGYFASCLQAHALKIAAVLHVLEGGLPHLLDGDSMREGQALVESLIPGTAQLYASLVPTPYAKMRAGIMRVVGGCGVDGTLAQDLDRMVIAAQGVRPRDVAEARVAMVREGLLKLLPNGRYSIGG